MLHSDRYSTTGVTLRKSGVVIHTNEGPDGSGASLDRYMASPGDRPLGDGRKYGSGYHARARDADGWVTYVGPEAGPFAAPPCNKTWWHIVIPGWSRQTRNEWLTDVSRDFIRSVARFVVWAWERDGRTWPLVRADDLDLQLGDGGYTSHNFVSKAWRQSNHTDPGPNFPWDVLAADIAELTAPAPEPEPQPIVTTRSIDMIVLDFAPNTGNWTAFILSGDTLRHLSDGNTVNVLAAGQVPRIDVTEEQLTGVLRDFRAGGACPVPMPSGGLRDAWNASAGIAS